VRERPGQAGAPGHAMPVGELTRVLESLRGDLIRFTYWLAGDLTVAEDLAQETLLRAWHSRRALPEHPPLRPCSLTNARREHARLYERKRLPLKVEFREDEALTSHDEDPRIEELRRAILTLPNEYRIPLAMQVLGGFTMAEIAVELNLSTVAVLASLYR